MKLTMKGAIVTALVVAAPVMGLLTHTGTANAQLRARPTEQILERPVEVGPTRPQPATEVFVIEPLTVEPADNSGGGSLPADDPWITHCLTDHDAGEDIDDCLKDGGY